MGKSANQVGVVVHGEVGQPGAGIGVHADLITLFELEQDGGASHGVLVVVLMVLVEDGGYLFSVEADGEQSFLVIMGGNVENKHVAAAHGCVENTSVGIHATTNVGACAIESKIFFTTTIVGFCAVGIEVNG